MDEQIRNNLLEKFGKLITAGGERYYNMKKLIIEAYDGEYDYLLPLGTRNRGKSYQAKECALWEAYNECEYAEWLKNKSMVKKYRYMFAYNRRWDTDVTTMAVLDYFKSHTEVKEGKKKNRIQEITKGEYDTITVWQGVIYFGTTDKDTGNVKKGKEIGRVFITNLAQKYKSREFPRIGNIIAEEIIPDDKRYCSNEVTKFNSICSTIARGDHLRIMLIGNTLGTYCPYFTEWNLTKVLNQKPGTIAKYRIDTGDRIDNKPLIIGLIIEMCDGGGIDVLTIGETRKSIAHGEWQVELYPTLGIKDERYDLSYTLDDFDCYYDVLIDDCKFLFMMKLLRIKKEDKNYNNEPFLYVYPFTGDKKSVIRRITNEYDASPFVTVDLDVVTKYDDLVRNLVKNKKIKFSDSICGEQFYNVIKERGGL